MFSLVIALWAYIFIAYIAWNRISTFLRQFYPESLANFVGSIIIFFINAVLFIRWFDQIVALPRWVLLLLSYIWSLTTKNNGIFFPVLLYCQFFWPYFCVTILWVSCLLRHLRFLAKLLSGVSSKFLRNSIKNF